MKIIFLGTSAGAPTRSRFTSATALEFNKNSWVLFDAGEGTQFRIRDAKLKLSKLDYIFLTHLHGDHTYGLFGVLASRGMHRITKPLKIFAPEGIKRLVDTVIELTEPNISYDIEVVEVKDGDFFEFEKFDLEVVEMAHSIKSVGFVIKEKKAPEDEPKEIEKSSKKVIKLEPNIGSRRLKGADVVIDNEIGSVDTLIDSSKPKKIILAGDNSEPERFLKFEDIDVMVHETTYIQKDFDKLQVKFEHTTVKDLAIVAQKMGVKRLIMTHISPRYTKNREVELLQEAKEHYKGYVTLADDFMVVNL